MKPMTPAQERKALLDLLDQLETGKSGFLASTGLSVTVRMLFLLFFIVLFLFVDKVNVLPVLAVVFVACLLGAMAGLSELGRMGAVRWPALRTHIDRESVRRRVAELDAGA